MKRLMTGTITAVAAAFSLSAAVPSAEELRGAQAKVLEAMKEVRAEFENGEKEAEDVANYAISLVDVAETSAQKYLLYKGAMMFFVRAKKYDRASETARMMANAMGGASDEEMVAFLEPAMRKNRREARELADLYRKHEERVALAKEAENLKRELQVQPAVTQWRRQLGEVYALLGDWKCALKEFAALSGTPAKIAKAELEAGNDLGKVKALKHADFWWKYPNRNPLGKKTQFRQRAAEFYRIALSDSSLSDMQYKNISRKLDEIEAEKPETSISKKASPATKDGRRAPIGFTIDNAKFNMLACTPGSFRFSLDFKKPERKITITRHYWMGETPVTYEQWWSVMTPDKSKRKPIYMGGEKAPVTMVSREDIEKFCQELTRRNKRYLPSGYEFRLPTVAEWEWAGRAGRKIPKIDYTKPYDPKTQDPYDVAFYFGPQQVGTFDCASKPLGVEAGFSFKLPKITEIFKLECQPHSDWFLSLTTPYPVGKFTPNKWGFLDFIGNSAELMADTFSHAKIRDEYKDLVYFHGNLGHFHGIKRYQAALDNELKDPCFAGRDNKPGCDLYSVFRSGPITEKFVSYPDGTKFPNGCCMTGTWIWFRRDAKGPISGFRLCLGPKLKLTYID